MIRIIPLSWSSQVVKIKHLGAPFKIAGRLSIKASLEIPPGALSPAQQMALDQYADRLYKIAGTLRGDAPEGFLEVEANVIATTVYDNAFGKDVVFVLDFANGSNAEGKIPGLDHKFRGPVKVYAEFVRTKDDHTVSKMYQCSLL